MAEHRAPRAPYPGLRPFSTHEGAIFFGREAHVGRMLELLARERFLAVIGASGSGKSSLVRAGLLPAVLAGWGGGGSDWRVAVLRPGLRPIGALAQALLSPEVLGPELGAATADTAATAMLAALVESELERSPHGLVTLVDGAQRRHGGGQPFDLLVVVDQFEEIFRYAAESEQQADEADAFVKLLLEPRRQGARIHVALTMRSEFLGHCMRFLDLPDAINQAQYLTPRLTRDQLSAAVTQPARRFASDVEPALVTEVVNAAGADLDQLPVLQHALARLWEQTPATPQGRLLRRQTLRDIGGVAGALDRHAESLYLALPADQQVLAELLFRQLTEAGAGGGGLRDIRRPQRLGDIAAASERDWRAFLPVIDAFAAEGVHFLTVGSSRDDSRQSSITEDTVIDISHEALIRQWTRLQRWAADEAERARTYARLRQRAEGDLLTGTDLARALEWRDGRAGDAATAWKPSAAWAARHAPGARGGSAIGFAEVMAYIARSADEKQAEDQRREAATQALRQRDAWRARFAFGLAALATVACLVVARFYVAARDARLVADAAAQTAVAAKSEAVDAARAALEQKTEAEQQRAEALRLKNIADAQRSEIVQERAAALAAADAAKLARQRAESALRRLERSLAENQSLQEQLSQARALQYRGIAAQAPAQAKAEPPSRGLVAAAPAAAIGGRLVDDAALAAVAPALSAERRAAMLPHLQSAMAEAGIDTPLRQAAFIATIAYESDFTRFVEDFNYRSAARLRAIFPSRFTSEEHAQSYLGQPEKTANRIYANRLGNGPEESGDGWRYRGRGPIQIPGKANYKSFGDKLGLDLVGDPELAATDAVGFRIAATYWRSKDLNKAADSGDIAEITSRLTGREGNLLERQERYVRFKQALAALGIQAASAGS